MLLSLCSPSSYVAVISHGNRYLNVTYFLLGIGWQLIAGHIVPSDLISKPCWHKQ